MANWGDVIAQGVLQGIGDTGMRYVEDMRRTRMNERKMNQSMDLFKRQSLFTQKQKTLEQMNASAEEWKQAAQMDTGQLAYNVAMKMTDGFAKGDRAKAFRDSMKRLNGKSKQELLAIGGYTQPDYSQFVSDPDFMDAIPSAAISGMDPAQYGMDQVFKYDPREYQNMLQASAEKLTDYQREVNNGYKLIRNRIGSATGMNLSDAVVADLYGDGSGIKMQTQGPNNIDPAMTRYGKLLNKVYFEVGGTVKMRNEMTDDDWEDWAAENGIEPPQGTTEAPEETGMNIPEPAGTEALSSYETPETAEYLQEQEEKKAAKERLQASRKVGEKKGKVIASYKALNDLDNMTANLSDGAKEYLFGAANWKGLGSISDKITQLAAKTGDPAAQEAMKYLSLITNVTATLKHEQYGSAQTQTELADFASQLGRPGFFQNPDTLRDQLQTRKTLVGNDLQSSIGRQDREFYLEEHPEADYLSEAFGMQRDYEEPMETEGSQQNQTVSDLDPQTMEKVSMLPEDDQQYIQEALRTGQATPEQVKAYLQTL